MPPVMRILIVSPHFPPSNAADMHRVRLVLPYLKGQGVEAEVLTVAAEQVAAPLDPWLAAGLPVEVPVHRVQALSLRWARVPGLGSLAVRARAALQRRGDALLGTGAFDLVYFSTTMFGVHTLGVHWKRRFGIPFVMDYQDPWVSDYYRNHPQVPPPGGRLKYALADRLARYQEPGVLRACSGITSVSAAYPEQLARRYPWLRFVGGDEAPAATAGAPSCGQVTMPVTVLPFPGDDRDFRRLQGESVRQRVFNREDGLQHWVYVGRGGGDMRFALRALFGALRRVRDERGARALEGLRLHFIGTSYAAAGRGQKTVEPLAAEFGLEAAVREHTDRIPYSETLSCLQESTALIVPGSDDPGYTASKVYPYLLAGRPLLAIFHEASSVATVLRTAGGGNLVTFRPDEPEEAVMERVWASPGLRTLEIPHIQLAAAAFEPHTARAQARHLITFWNQCLTRA